MGSSADSWPAVRYELRSVHQLELVAAASLPLGLVSSAPRRTMHRDLYLDTEDDSLRGRGIMCRLRLGQGVHLLSLRIGADPGRDPVWMENRVRASDPAGALSERCAVVRRIAEIVDPSRLETRLEFEVDRLTTTATAGLLRRTRLELHFEHVTARRNGTARGFQQLSLHLRRGGAADLQRIATALADAHGLRPLAGDPRDHAALLLRWTHADGARPRVELSDEMGPELRAPDRTPPDMLCPELSLLAFQRRVLALADDPSTPLRARLRFLGIVTSNMDELYMVRLPDLRRAARGDDADVVRADDGLSPRDRHARVAHEVEEILAEQARCAQRCLDAAAVAGARLLPWGALTDAERGALQDRFRQEMLPDLSPYAMTLSPGHPLPHLPHLGLSLAVVFRRTAESEAHLAELELPPDIGRLLPVPGRAGACIAIEEVLRANVDLLYPSAQVDGAWLFRVTRGGDLALDEEMADDLLEAVASATERRVHNPAVRVEVERTTPAFVGELILENLRRDARSRGEEGAVEEIQVIDTMLDLRCLAELPLPDLPELEYAPLPDRAPIDTSRSMFSLLGDREELVHHPFDPFDATVVRFLSEAAADRDVTGIRITLYRVGATSPVIDALLAAAQAGKRVVALVELKARFDEEHNVGWARALERAGGRVIYGLVGYKVHAKAALVVRREDGRLRQYVHVGTGNYSARSSRQYTDLSLFSSRESLCADVAELFNELAGSSRPPVRLTHGALVAPHQLLGTVLAFIERERRHAREGLPASITIKINGLSDPEVVRALYRASQAGVRIDLVVRGICTLRPGVAGLSTGIRVVSVVGRFLEHSRIYRFENGGTPEFLIGSADLRPRNLRRRVELLVPVLDHQHRTRLDRLLALYLEDATGWELDAAGRYIHRSTGRPGTQAIVAGAVGEGPPPMPVPT